MSVGLSAGDDGHAGAEESADPAAREAETRRKILVVDDDPGLLATAARLLERAGFVAYTCFARPKRLSIIRETRPDLVLMDVNSQFLAGADVIRLMKTVPELRDIRVVLFSSSDGRSARRIARDAGAWGWIPKSSLGMDFGARVTAALRGRRAGVP